MTPKPFFVAAVPVDQRIKDPTRDAQSHYCGHGMLPADCPYEFCGYRDTMERVAGLLAAISDAVGRPVAAGLDVRGCVVLHGIDCVKAYHISGIPYYHDADDDGPCEDNGAVYCGRCHERERIP